MDLPAYYQNLSREKIDYFSKFRSSVKKYSTIIENIKWTYFKAGTGPPLILFHGGFLSGEMYFHQFLYFKNTNTVIAPTVPVEINTVLILQSM